MARSRRWALPVIGFIAVGLLFIGLPLFMFFQDPMGSFLVLQRGALEDAGTKKRHVQADTRPPVTYFEGRHKGRTWVLVHGFGDQAGGWSALASHLTTSRRLLVPDLPGHGESPAPVRGPLTFEAVYQGLNDVIDAETEPDEPFVLVGNSLGGWLAQRYALEHPTQVSHLVLINSAGLDHALPRDVVLGATPDDLRRKMSMMMAEPPTLPDSLVEGMAAWNAEQTQWAELFDDAQSGPHHLDARLASLSVPTTVIWGVDDQFFDLDYANRLTATLPGATLVRLEGCGHAPQVDCADALAEVLVGLEVE